MVPWSTPSTAFMRAFEGSVIHFGQRAWAQVDNCQLRVGHHYGKTMSTYITMAKKKTEHLALPST